MDDAPLLQPQRAAASSSAAAAGPSKPAMTPAAPPSLRRKRLTDISNLSIDRSAAMSSSFTSTGKENPVSIAAATSTKDAYITQLLKENNALIRALGERNKVIELSAAEIKNVRCALQKLTQQNHQLAHANSLMLAERNQDKDKLKTLQHEVGCVHAALKAQNFELEEAKKLNRQLKARIGNEVNLRCHSEMNFVTEDLAIPVAQNTSEEEKKLNRQLQARIGCEQVNLGGHSEMDFVVEDPAISVAQNMSEEEEKLSRQLKARIDSEQVNLGCHSEVDFVMEDPAIPVSQNTSEEEKKLNRQLKTRIGSEQVNLGCHSEMNFVVEDPAIPVAQNTSEEGKKLNRPLKARIGSEQDNLGCYSEMDFVLEIQDIPVAQNTSEPVTVDANADAQPELDLVMEAIQKKAPSTNRKRSTRSQPPCVTNPQDGVEYPDFVMENPDIPVAQNTSEPVTMDANADAQPELDLFMEDPPIPAIQKKAPSTNRKRSMRSQPPCVTNHQDRVKEKDVSSRRSSSRRTTSLRNNLCELDDNLIEIEGINLSVVPQLIDVSSRRSSRRRTTSLRNNLCEPNESLIEIEDINLSVVPQSIDDPMSRDSSNQAVPSAPSVSNVSTGLVTEERPKEPIGTLQTQIQEPIVTSQVQIQEEPIKSQVPIQKEPIGTSQVQIHEERRLSVDRPTRRAREKVCYKEIPLNVKMRREN